MKKMKMKMIHIDGDLFSAPPHIGLVHCVSADFAMGAGIAAKMVQHYPWLKELRKTKAVTYCCVVAEHPKRTVYNLVTKESYWQKPTYTSLRLALENIAESPILPEIAMPEIGCGLDRLEWDKVETIIKEVLGEVPITIYVYHYGR